MQEGSRGDVVTLTVAVAGNAYTAHPADGAVTIGRELPAQIRLDEPAISRTHVRLEPAGDHWILTDAGSRNGTYFEGRRIESLVVDRELSVHLGDPQGLPVRLSPTVTRVFDHADQAHDAENAAADVDDDEESTEAITPTVQAAIAVDAAEIAIRGLYARMATLPVTDDPRFGAEVAVLLADLRRLESTLTGAAERATGRPELAITLGEVRQAYSDLMRRAARAPSATLGQRLYAARHRLQLSVQEAANAAGVNVSDVSDAEAGLPVQNPVAATLRRFVDIVDDAAQGGTRNAQH
ncbi:FHA domain-containing protein [Mycolicibacterium phlei RIVM601174]|nr:FHA domain-containing protein [Mycolicibacterium phlei]EID09396.1 FHA domain-containing protein [Mycolicibacterium phlei RIVM601174]MBF4194860.1 FHA domain-containing protein [Mycolicibacterium phlei]